MKMCVTFDCLTFHFLFNTLISSILLGIMTAIITVNTYCNVKLNRSQEFEEKKT